jgi:hypothetical protein
MRWLCPRLLCRFCWPRGGDDTCFPTPATPARTNDCTTPRPRPCVRPLWQSCLTQDSHGRQPSTARALSRRSLRAPPSHTRLRGRLACTRCRAWRYATAALPGLACVRANQLSVSFTPPVSRDQSPSRSLARLPTAPTGPAATLGLPAVGMALGPRVSIRSFDVIVRTCMEGGACHTVGLTGPGRRVHTRHRSQASSSRTLSDRLACPSLSHNSPCDRAGPTCL